MLKAGPAARQPLDGYPGHGLTVHASDRGRHCSRRCATQPAIQPRVDGCRPLVRLPKAGRVVHRAPAMVFGPFCIVGVLLAVAAALVART